MRHIPLNLGWRRIEGRMNWFAPEADVLVYVDLPDDFMLNHKRTKDAAGGASVGFIPGGEATYFKDLDFDPAWEGKCVLLYVDGAYMNAEVTLNKDHLFHHPYGYTAFTVDLTKSLYREYPNRLAVKTESIQPNSRWYSGGGLFREVSLYVGDKVRIEPWDVFCYTVQADAKKATLHVSVTVTSDVEGIPADIEIMLGGKTVHAARCTLTGEKTEYACEIEVDTPKLWSVDEPNLYALKVCVSAGEYRDEYEDEIGIRTIEIDFAHGFRLNGVEMKLRGGCIHHDNTLLGARAPYAAEERKIRLLKEVGYNAIRCAHNPPSSNLLKACDRLGMLVMDESFDMWTMGKNTLDYHLYFEKWWRFDTASMVKRDRNHPSVYCWSIGNEIPEITGKSDGARWTKLQADYVRSLDSTRPVTSAIHGAVDIPPEMAKDMPRRRADRKKMLTEGLKMPLTTNGRDLWAEQTKDACDALDIVGYNYLWERYEGDRIAFPNRVIHATETHSYTTYDYWKAVEANSNVIGDFIWTAYDNLGEAGAGRVIFDLDEPLDGLCGQYPWLSCYQGDLDLDGNRRPQSYFRKILWGLDDGIHLFTTAPEHTGKPYYGMGWHWADVKQNWTFDPKYIGEKVQLEAYADCDEVAFYVNGEKKGVSKVEKLKAFLTVEYAPGKVEAAAIRNGKEVARCALETAGKAARILLTPDRTRLSADGMDIAFVKAEILDENGVLVQIEPKNLHASVCGAGTLAGFGSGNPKTEENYGTHMRETFDGRALVAVRSSCEKGQITLTVTAQGLPAASITLNAE
ncbi:MAG: glycoside hydrolase family 2 TIM barrel-domain containing protein [Christensenellales bacterium]